MGSTIFLHFSLTQLLTANLFPPSNLQWLVLTHQWIVIHIAIKNLRIQMLRFTKQ